MDFEGCWKSRIQAIEAWWPGGKPVGLVAWWPGRRLVAWRPGGNPNLNLNLDQDPNPNLNLNQTLNLQ